METPTSPRVLTGYVENGNAPGRRGERVARVGPSAEDWRFCTQPAGVNALARRQSLNDAHTRPEIRRGERGGEENTEVTNPLVRRALQRRALGRRG